MEISINVIAILNTLLLWPSDFFYFNALIALWFFLYWCEAVVVHANDYLTLMATDFEWTVFMIFPFICLQKNLGAAKQSIAGRIVIAKLSLVFTEVRWIMSTDFIVLDN